MRKFLIALLTVFTVLNVFMVSAFAESSFTECSSVVSIENIITGDNVPNKEFSYKISALTANAPIPSNNIITIEGNGRVNINFIFDKPDTYEYELVPVTEDEPNFKIDRTSYHVYIYVTSNEQNQLSAAAIIQNSNNEKAESVLFKNSYGEPEKPISDSDPLDEGNSPKTGDETNITFWIVSASISIIFIGAFLFIILKKRNENKIEQ